MRLLDEKRTQAKMTRRGLATLLLVPVLASEAGRMLIARLTRDGFARAYIVPSLLKQEESLLAFLHRQSQTREVERQYRNGRMRPSTPSDYDWMRLSS